MDKPISDMTNDEIYQELERVGNMMDEFYAAKNLKERNVLVPRFRELRIAYKWDFEIGQTIETNTWHSKWQETRITDYDESDNMYLVRNDKGWEIWVDGKVIRQPAEKVVQVKILPPDPAEDFEQMELALF